MHPLTKEQLNSLPQDRDDEITATRFMSGRFSINIATGDMHGGNIINQYIYWDLSRKARSQIVQWLRANNPGEAIKAVVSQ